MERESLLPLPFRQLVDEAVRLTKKHFLRIYPPIVTPLVIGNAALVLLQTRLWNDLDANDPWGAFTAGCGMAVLATAVTLLAYTAMEAATTEAVIGRQVGMRRCWGFALRPRVWGTLILLFSVASIGFAFFVLPGLYLFLLFSFVIQVMVAEERFGSAALARSRRIITFNPKRRFLVNPMTKAFAAYCIGLAISWTLSVVVTLPFQLAAGVSALETAIEEPDAMMPIAPLWLTLPSNILQTLVTTATQLYVFFALSLLYWDTRRRHEAWDLEAAIDEMAADAAR